MHAQMRAERDRRATVTEARGFQEAAIARADGEKQASILAAEGRKQSAILDAEGDARAIELRATAEQLRLEKIGQGEGEAARARLGGIKAAEADNNVLVVEYLSALERIGDGRATKLVIPAEFSGLLGTVAAITDTARTDDGGDEVRPKRGLPIPEQTERVAAPAPRSGGTS
jgi:regulator of protease activity HflC (stomatin/prohibitin superfamily)